MRPVFGVLLLCALPCCTHAPRTPEETCRAQAEDDPSVHDLVIQGLGSSVNYDRNRGAIAEARAKYVKACLQRQGIVPKRGGVQAPDRASSTLFN